MSPEESGAVKASGLTNDCGKERKKISTKPEDPKHSLQTGKINTEGIILVL